MPKTSTENVKKIRTSFLRSHGYFKGWASGKITWTNLYSGNKNHVEIEVLTSTVNNYLRIYYPVINQESRDRRYLDYKIPLTTTPCRFGGFRYWFICPAYRNGKYCGRRVGVLYRIGDYFACRNCHDLTYESRKLSGKFKKLGSLLSFQEIEKSRRLIKRTHYRSMPTKRYLRQMSKEAKAFKAYGGRIILLSDKADQLALKYARSR
ncbi:MAG: hypothetical protein V4664_00840 [Patescibacteria group bacterium]